MAGYVSGNTASDNCLTRYSVPCLTKCSRLSPSAWGWNPPSARLSQQFGEVLLLGLVRLSITFRRFTHHLAEALWTTTSASIRLCQLHAQQHFNLVQAVGLEPTTSPLGGVRSIQLSYACMTFYLRKHSTIDETYRDSRMQPQSISELHRLMVVHQVQKSL